MSNRRRKTGETALVQSTEQNPALGILPDSRSVLCIPVSYGETLLGVLNVESKSESAFTPDDKLILGTLADLLATALHNSFVFQKLQRQSITDGLTGIKTRGFFLEAVQPAQIENVLQGQNFKCCAPSKQLVSGEIDFAHAARTADRWRS